MTLAKYEAASAASLQGNKFHQKSITASSTSKCHENTSSVVKIGSVKVHFTQNFKKDDYPATTSSVLRQHIEAAKRINDGEVDEGDEDEELKCCGVPWPPSRIPLAASYSNYRRTNRRICISRNTVDRGNKQQNFFTAAPPQSPPSSVVHRCTSVWPQLPNVRVVRPTLVSYCFGGSAKRHIVSNLREFGATADANRSVVTASECDRWCCKCCDDSTVASSEYVPIWPQNAVADLQPFNRLCSSCCRSCGTRHRASSSPPCGSSASSSTGTACNNTSTTLDHFQKFRFGSDRSNRYGGGRRGSAGSHKKKVAPSRTSDKSINLKKLTDKLKPSSHPHDGDSSAGPAAFQSMNSHEPPPPPPLPPPSFASKPPPPPPPIQVFIPLKGDDSDEGTGASAAEGEKDADIFDGVNLKLMKPESRTIVGSYYQRSIPFRSASFSQVHYLPEDRKYIRNSLRKLGPLKRVSGSGGENVSATLPRTNISATCVGDPYTEQSSLAPHDVHSEFLHQFTDETAETSQPKHSDDFISSETQEEKASNAPEEGDTSHALLEGIPQEGNVSNSPNNECIFGETVLDNTTFGESVITDVISNEITPENFCSEEPKKEHVERCEPMLANAGTETAVENTVSSETFGHDQPDKSVDVTAIQIDPNLTSSIASSQLQEFLASSEQSLPSHSLQDAFPTPPASQRSTFSSSEERVSLIEQEPAEPLTSSVIPVNAPTINKKYPQPPKRTKHKHKHRHRPCARLYFSDENIFATGATLEANDLRDDYPARVESVENISVTIRAPEAGDSELRKGNQPTIVGINFINDSIDKDQEIAVESSTAANPTPAEIVADREMDIDRGGKDGNTLAKEEANSGSSGQHDPPPPPPLPPKREKLVVDVSTATESMAEADHVHFYQTPSSPEDSSLRPQWPIFMARHGRKLTPQTSTEKEDEPELYSSRKYHLFSRGDSFSEADSDPGEKRSISPAAVKDGRLSPLPHSGHEMSDSDSRSTTPRSRHYSSTVPYSKRPLRGPYLEMIVNEQKKPENLKNAAFNKLLDSRGGWILPNSNDRAVDDYYLRRSNTSPPSSTQKLNVGSSMSSVASSASTVSLLPKRKISANIPFCGSTSLRAPAEEKTLVHHQRTTSSPSQLEYYPDQLSGHSHSNPVPNQQLLHQLLRGSSEHSLIQDVDLLKKMYPSSSYKDTRSHIVVELYDTERSYVESLHILVTKYLQPLKSPECSNLIDTYVVEEIFYKIPEILAYHEIFLEELRIRLEGWNKSKCIGDIFLETFTKPAVIDSYIAFINNRKTANESIKQITQTKPAFVRFIDAMAREHKGKLTLDSLLIMPVQRIPRYELLIQSLLKHTEICHPDYDKLQEALRQIHELALRINCTERDSLELEQIENLIDGLANLVTGDRTFLRYDLVSMTSGQGPSRKERALFLFNDLLIITSVKRRSSTVKKAVLSSPASITSSLEANKYKLLMKIPLEHLDIVKVKDENLRRMMREMEYLTDDVNTLSQMVDLVATLHCPHGQIEENIREMLGALNKQLNDRHVSESQLSYLELALNTRNSVENISVLFPKPEKRTNWEETFLEAKTRLNVSGDRRLSPEFLTSVPIRKTRAGLQFTCAAASYNQQDVWVCNSDGYVGQVCILSLNPEPAVTSCNGVCNARILSVTSVPVSRYIEKCQDSPDSLDAASHTPSTSLHKSEPFEEVTESIPVENLERKVSDICLDRNAIGSLAEMQSAPQQEYDLLPSRNAIGYLANAIFYLAEMQSLYKEGIILIISSSSSDEDDEDELIEEQKTVESPSPETVDSTMWLGTEDGVVHIYNCADSLRIKRNRLKIQHNSAVYCIFYVDKSVFVSLANGEVYMYNWCASLGWNTTDPIVILVGCVTSPVSRMFLVCGKLWCVCHNIIKTLNIHTLQIENSFTIIGENNRAITSVAVSGFSVYLSLQNSAVLRVIHGISCEILAEVNIAPAVTKMLSGVDDIIRQHKAACLRVTSLLACKELLWIGTSAGVILTMPLPIVKQDTTKITNISPPIGLPHGHTGHVRFLTAVKYKSKKKDTTLRRSSKVLERKPDLSNVNKMLIISGGDGYEDFRSSSVSEIAGREDSTNHLLIWRF